MTIRFRVRDYSKTPGARYIKDGPYSGEDFRKKELEVHFLDKNNSEDIEIDMDGGEGYATSFLEEAFGGLARIFGIDRCLARLKFISQDDELLIEEITQYIREANDAR